MSLLTHTIHLYSNRWRISIEALPHQQDALAVSNMPHSHCIVCKDVFLAELSSTRPDTKAVNTGLFRRSMPPLHWQD
jgi:hypothetical protein